MPPNQNSTNQPQPNPQPQFTPVAPHPSPHTSGDEYFAHDTQAAQMGQSEVQATASNQPAAKPAPHPVNQNSTQNALDIAEIRDGIVIMNDGSFRAVVMCKSINFDLMSNEEKEAVEYSYQGFLNSLYFPVQIVIKSRKVNLKPYLSRLEKIKSEHDNMLLVLLMEDYIEFMKVLSQETNIMDKMFYVVIPYHSHISAQNAVKETAGMFRNIFNYNQPQQHVTIDESTLESAKDELRNRVQSVMSGLNQAGIQSLPLDTQELIELYYDSYNPDTATRQKLKNFTDLTAPIITKGQGQATQPHMNRELD